VPVRPMDFGREFAVGDCVRCGRPWHVSVLVRTWRGPGRTLPNWVDLCRRCENRVRKARKVSW
jgi:hypothetical protein